MSRVRSTIHAAYQMTFAPPLHRLEAGRVGYMRNVEHNWVCCFEGRTVLLVSTGLVFVDSRSIKSIVVMLVDLTDLFVETTHGLLTDW